LQRVQITQLKPAWLRASNAIDTRGQGGPSINHRFLFVAAILLSVSSGSAKLPMGHTIGHIEAVFEFRGAMPTGRQRRVQWVHLCELSAMGR
jgi:hypothetical protein